MIERKDMIKVLFVCHGNICRSPLAEYIFKYKTRGKDYYCESRAVSYEEEGNDIHPSSKAIMDKYHIPYSKHRATRITQKDYEDFDVIFVMDESNLRIINRIVDDHDHKIRMLNEKEIEDPWYSGNYEKVYFEICEGIDRFLNTL